jgi:hypothetical protein
MKGLNRGIRLPIAVLALFLAVPADAQESLGYGKTPAQMFASDCAICHKTVNGLSRNAGLFGLDSFLRQHYTASRESAAAISAYIQALDKGAPPPAARRAKRTAKGSDTKGSDKKPAAAKSGEQKSGEQKSGEQKPAEAKASDTKSSEPKAGEAKPAEAKPAEAKPAEPKPIEAKAEAKPETKPEAKPEAKPSEPVAAQSAKPE